VLISNCKYLARRAVDRMFIFIWSNAVPTPLSGIRGSSSDDDDDDDLCGLC
jgi:hypothetical protein